MVRNHWVGCFVVAILTWSNGAQGQSQSEPESTQRAPEGDPESELPADPSGPGADDTLVLSPDGSSERTVVGTAALIRWIVLGTSGIILLSGVVFFGVGQREFDDDVPPGTPWLAVAEDYDEGREKITLGILLMVLGGAGTAGALAWILASDSDDGDSGERVELRVGPGALALAGTFR